MRDKMAFMKKLYRYLAYLGLALGLAKFVTGLINAFLLASSQEMAIKSSALLLIGGGILIYASFLALKALKKSSYLLHALITSFTVVILDIANLILNQSIVMAFYGLLPLGLFILTYIFRKKEF